MSTWFITGCSSGFGTEIAKAALTDGHNVVATARDAGKLKDLEKLGAYILSLDITAPDDEINKVVAQAVKKFGSIDILVNNAGYILEGAIEEAKYLNLIGFSIDTFLLHASNSSCTPLFLLLRIILR